MNTRPRPRIMVPIRFWQYLLGAAGAALGAHVTDAPRFTRWARNQLRKLSSSKYTPHQGPRECARRRRQIAEGFIRAN